MKFTSPLRCYLPPGSGDFPAFTPAEAGTRFSDPGGMQGWVDLGDGYNSHDSLPAKNGHRSQKLWPRQCTADGNRTHDLSVRRPNHYTVIQKTGPLDTRSSITVRVNITIFCYNVRTTNVLQQVTVCARNVHQELWHKHEDEYATVLLRYRWCADRVHPTRRRQHYKVRCVRLRRVTHAWSCCSQPLTFSNIV